jgi:hypothetical protein
LENFAQLPGGGCVVCGGADPERFPLPLLRDRCEPPQLRLDPPSRRAPLILALAFILCLDPRPFVRQRELLPDPLIPQFRRNRVPRVEELAESSLFLSSVFCLL